MVTLRVNRILTRNGFHSLEEQAVDKIKILIERHDDCYVGYPLGFRNGVIVGQGETYAEAFHDTESAIQFFIEHYGKDVFFQHLQDSTPTLEAYIAEITLAV